MNSLNILIIDDSTEFASSLERLITHIGHFASICLKSEQAKNILNQNNFDLILIDCLMPVKDGFTLASELNLIIKEKNLNTKIILMSGVLIDKVSTKEAESFNYIEDYLIKPISKKKLEEVFNRCSQQENAFVLKPLFHENMNEHKVSEILNLTKKINGFELSYILPLISNFGFSYTINLADSFTKIYYTITIKSGFLYKISSSEYSNSLGELLVGLGYLTRESLSSYINSKEFKTNKTRIGTTLVNLNLLSPHAIPMAMKQQHINRLNGLLSIQNMTCTFMPEPEEKNFDDSTSLNQYEIKKEMCIWLESKAPESLFQNLNSIISEVTFIKSPFYTQSKTQNSKELDKILSSSPKDLTKIDLILIFSNLIQDNLKVQNEINPSGSTKKEILLKLIQSLKIKLKQNNPYSLFNIHQNNASDQNISKAYQKLSKELHPDRITTILSTQELYEAKSVFVELTTAFNLIKTSGNRITYESFKKNQKTQMKLEYNNVLESSKILLNKGEYSKAFKLLDTNEMHKNYPNEFGLYYLWAALKSKNSFKVNDSINTFMQKEQKTLTNNALYYYIKALQLLAQSDFNGFQKFIALSLENNPQFLPARRELQIVKSRVGVVKKTTRKSWFNFKKSS